VFENKDRKNNDEIQHRLANQGSSPSTCLHPALTRANALKLGPTFMLYALHQRSQTRGPREGPIRPGNIRRNIDFKRNIGGIGLFSKKNIGY